MIEKIVEIEKKTAEVYLKDNSAGDLITKTLSIIDDYDSELASYLNKKLLEDNSKIYSKSNLTQQIFFNKVLITILLKAKANNKDLQLTNIISMLDSNLKVDDWRNLVTTYVCRVISNNKLYKEE